METSNIYLNALERLSSGIQLCAQIVKGTMGPGGSNVLIQRNLMPGHELTNDGATIIQAMILKDSVENMGLNFLKEAVSRSNNNSGDGSSSTVLLLSEILREGIIALQENKITTLQLKNELDENLKIIESSIHEQTRQITVEEIPAVARIAGESEEIAGVLGKIYKDIGKDGIIHLEGSGSYETSYSLIEGVRFVDTGYLSPYMAYNEDEAKESKKALYHKPAILVTKNKIQNVSDIDPLLQALIAQGTKTLVIFTDDMDSNVARILIELQRNEKRSINILIIKAPILWKSYVFQDFAKITGATIIEDASGTRLGKYLQLNWLGTCDTIIVDKEETIVIGINDISQHIVDLTLSGLPDDLLRVSWLTTKTAILKLGAKSETELSYKRLKCEDAIFSSRAALRYGIVPGGGIALYNARHSLPDTIGGHIIAEALKAPLMQIIVNAGKWDDINPKTMFSGNQGYDANTNKIVDMFEAGIVDASAVVLGAIRNSLGIASTLLTTSSVITLPPKSTDELLANAAMRNIGM